ncbi:hypothetical protein [Borrelia sp. HM]|uniref:hypothetical protein n=1 Tax=Borrelia sp. HM TaxID=1882662 RepID=UPI001C80F2E1|nr:hypothetical protein [Borrelia sp. HM]
MQIQNNKLNFYTSSILTYTKTFIYISSLKLRFKYLQRTANIIDILLESIFSEKSDDE